MDNVDKLRAALKPFADSHAKFVADHVEAFSTDTPDETPVMIGNDYDAHYFICTVGDFRRAAEAIDR